MNWFHKPKLRLRALLGKQKLDAEMDDEMRSHIEMQTQENDTIRPVEQILAEQVALRRFNAILLGRLAHWGWSSLWWAFTA